MPTMFSPPQLATYFVLSATAAIFCLIAIWAATSRRHWFVRATLPLLALAALLPIQAHEPLIYLAMVMGQIVLLNVACRWIGRLWNARPPVAKSWFQSDAGCRLAPLREAFPTFGRWAAHVLQNESRQELAPQMGRFRFGLRDLLLAMVPVGIAAWIISQFGGVGLLIVWPDAHFASLWLAVIALLTWGAFASRWRWFLASLLVVAILGAACVDAEVLGDWLHASEAVGVHKLRASLGFVRRNSIILQLLWLYAQTALGILAGLGILAVASSTRRRPIWRVLAGCVFVASAALLALVYWQMIGAVDSPVSPPRSENAYPQVINVATRLKTASGQEAAILHREVLDLLDRPGHVELDWSGAASDPASADDISEGVLLRDLVRSLKAEAENLHAAGKHDEAAPYELAILKLGAMQLRGGLVLHALMGAGTKEAGTSLVAKHRAEYSSAVARQVIDEIAIIAQGRESAAAILDRDRAFESVAWRWRTRLQWAIDLLLYGHHKGPLNARQRNFFYDVFRRQQVDEQLLCADLAIRLYQQDHGRWPASLEDLVPKYAPQVPLDFYADAPLNYHPSGEGFLLYSVGPDGQDHGGRFGTRRDTMGVGFDLDLDTLSR